MRSGEVIVREASIPHTRETNMYRAIIGGKKKELREVEDELRSASIIKEDEEIVGIKEEVFFGSTLQRLEELVEDTSQGDRVIPVESVEM